MSTSETPPLIGVGAENNRVIISITVDGVTLRKELERDVATNFAVCVLEQACRLQREPG